VSTFDETINQRVDRRANQVPDQSAALWLHFPSAEGKRLEYTRAHQQIWARAKPVGAFAKQRLQDEMGDWKLERVPK
jgi:hypothetical protein